VGWAGPNSAPKRLGRSRPKRYWADLGPTKTPILFWAGSSPDSRAGPGSVWPTKGNPHCWARTNLAQQQQKTNGGNYFSPILLHAERTFCMQEETKATK